MKIAEIYDDVVVSGAQNVQVFTIEASAKAFSVLSQNLYSNTRGAMIRELSTNAYDAHVMSGVADKQFILTLPNSIEPTFKIRDFGPGLSEEQVNSVLTTFFKSTKTDSNDVVGCMGLGSKTPFGVSDSFTVTSYHGGLKTIYSAFLSSKRIPSVAKFASFESDEPTGLEIEVAVKSADFSLYQREVNDQLKYFKVKPIILGCSSFEWDAPEDVICSGTNWRLVTKGSCASVVQGQIRYPIHAHDIGSAFNEADKLVQDLLQRNSIIFDVSIGEVNVAPSREALYYDDETCITLINAAKRVIDELPTIIKKSIDSCETEYDARVKFNAIVDTLTSGYRRDRLEEMLRSSGVIQWNGIDVTTNNISIPEDDITSAFSAQKSWRGGALNKTPYYVRADYDSVTDTKQRLWSFRALSLKNKIWIHNQENVLSVTTRLRAFASEHANDNYSFSVITTTLTREQLAEKLGVKVDQVMSSLDLPKIKRKRSATKTKASTDITLLVYGHSLHDRNNWKSSMQVDKTDDTLKGFWVEMDRNTVVDGEITFDRLNYFVQGLIDLNIIPKDTTIYGFRQAEKKPKHNLVNLFDYVCDYIKANPFVMRTVQWEDDYKARRVCSASDNATKLMTMVHTTSPFYPVLEAVAKKQYTNNNQQYVLSVKKHFGLETVTELIGDVDSRYPILALIDTYHSSSTLHVVADYINLIDSINPTDKKFVTIV